MGNSKRQCDECGNTYEGGYCKRCEECHGCGAFIGVGGYCNDEDCSLYDVIDPFEKAELLAGDKG